MVLLGEFSEAELKRFSIRYENGYDIKSDERYNAWLRRYHPKEKLTGQGTYVHIHILIIINPIFIRISCVCTYVLLTLVILTYS